MPPTGQYLTLGINTEDGYLTVYTDAPSIMEYQAEVARNQGGPLLPLMSLTGKSLIQQVQEEGLRGALFNPGTPIELCMDTGELGQIPGHADEALDETLDTSATSN